MGWIRTSVFVLGLVIWAIATTGCGEALSAVDAMQGDPPVRDAEVQSDALVDAGGGRVPVASSLTVCGLDLVCTGGEVCDAALLCYDATTCESEEGDHRCHAVCDDGLCARGEECRPVLVGRSDGTMVLARPSASTRWAATS